MELLSPAGSPDALTAAVQNGANAVYLGCGDFNARRRAKNFTADDLAWAVRYCHVRGVKVYLTLNTLLADKELPAALDLAAQADRLGVDAVLVQDLGLAAALKRRCPGLPLHGSTQMTVHSLRGVQFCAGLGMERVVLSRELSKDAIAYICKNSPIEIEVFAHGALCMCYSGQCFLSAMVGARSGNRGLCAQPCRLPYNGGQPLSLKDMSLAGHLQELEEMGVACVKLEGRMKRPEYVAVVTSVYAAALREGRAPTPEELEKLRKAFSRSGFTQGYFEDAKGPEMFGVRTEEDAGAPDERFYAAARASYQKERPLVDVTMTAVLRSQEALRLTVRDEQGREATALGLPPEPARTRPLTEEDVREQLVKTGGTPYRVREAEVLLEQGLAVPKAALNALRRAALEELTALRAAPRRVSPAGPALDPRSAYGEVTLDLHSPIDEASFALRSPFGGPALDLRSAGVAPADTPRFVFQLSSLDQLTPALLSQPGIFDLPVHLIAAHPDRVKALLDAGGQVRAVLPTIIWDREAEETARQAQAAAGLGVTQALVNSWDAAELARACGLGRCGGWGLGALNAETLYALQALGFESATLSFEQKFSAIRRLPKPLPTEAIVYGRLPLMTLEQAPGGRPCRSLTDRKGMVFPVLPQPNGRAALLNSLPLYLADKEDWKNAGLAAVRFFFTAESGEECAKIIENYENSVPPATQSFTRGLYYRDVE